LGDLNINISPINKAPDARPYINMLISNRTFPLITKPTK